MMLLNTKFQDFLHVREKRVKDATWERTLSMFLVPFLSRLYGQ